ncbi:Uncharacterised protein [Mycobacteroides abscessus subsp. abscessus]|nr:Uncharacterised protein [Mycobacteroides abscessus subsp. abscessus]
MRGVKGVVRASPVVSGDGQLPRRGVHESLRMFGEERRAGPRDEGGHPDARGHPQGGDVSGARCEVLAELRIGPPVAHALLPAVVDLERVEPQLRESRQLGFQDVPRDLFVVGVPRAPHAGRAPRGASAFAQAPHVLIEDRRLTPPREEPQGGASLVERRQMILVGAHAGVAALEGSDEDTAAIYLVNDGPHPRPVVADRIVGRRIVRRGPTLVGGDAQRRTREVVPAGGRPGVVPAAVELAVRAAVQDREPRGTNERVPLPSLDKRRIGGCARDSCGQRDSESFHGGSLQRRQRRSGRVNDVRGSEEARRALSRAGPLAIT